MSIEGIWGSLHLSFQMKMTAQMRALCGVHLANPPPFRQEIGAIVKIAHGAPGWSTLYDRQRPQ